MKLPLLQIEASRILRTEVDALHSGAPMPVGQIFAFHSAAPLLDAAKALTSDELSLHELLLQMAIEGLWQMRTKHPALVGYIPDSEKVPVIRLYLMGRRELPFGNFTAVVSKYPGYMESGRGFIRGNRNVPLAYWEYPCSAFAIWSPAPEGVPFLTSDFESFESNGLTYWMLHREYQFQTRSFGSIEDALYYTINMLMANGHGFIVNVLGPKEAEAGRACTVQVVAQGMALGDGESGLALHLPFDPSCGEFGHLAEFLHMDASALFAEYKFNGIHCFVAPFGTNVDLAHKAILYVLAKVFGYVPSTAFTCAVFDDGPLDQAGKWRAPPGGWGTREGGAG
jgi:hypothetical protein